MTKTGITSRSSPATTPGARARCAATSRNWKIASIGRPIDDFFNSLLGPLYRFYRWLVLLFDPRAVLDEGGHGLKGGWAPTNFIDPFLISTIAKGDRPFFRVILRAALGVLHGNYPLIAALKQALVRLRVVEAIDFNDINTRRANPEGVFLVPNRDGERNGRGRSRATRKGTPLRSARASVGYG